MNLRAAAWACGLGFFVSACGGGGGAGFPSMFNTMGSIGTPSAAAVSSNLVFVNAAVDGVASNVMLIDSGSPPVIVDPTVFGDGSAAASDVGSAVQVHVDLSLLDTNNQPVVTVDAIPALQVSTAMGDALGFGGILGGDVMRQFSIQLDYATPNMDGFSLGGVSVARADVASPGSTIPFTLKGGGLGIVPLGTSIMPTVALPATRIPLTVNIEGTDHNFILDTGSSVVEIRESVFDALVSDGRATMDNFPIMTVTGNSNATVSRAKTLSVGGAVTDDVAVMTIPGDDLINSIGAEIGKGYQLDGLLGGTFLRNFLVTIDYPNGQLDLEPYLTPPIPDEFRRVGLTIAFVGTRYVVASIFMGTDAGDAATQPINIGDEVVAINNTDLVAPTAQDEFATQAGVTEDRLLDGTAGTTIPVTFGRTHDPAIENQTIPLLVQDLIPNPQ